MGPVQGSGSCQCCLSFSLILRSAMVSSAGAGFSSFSSSMRSDPRAFLRMAALAFPSRRRCVRVRRAGRVSSFEFLVSSWEPSSGSRGWVPAFAGTTVVGAGTTGELARVLRCRPPGFPPPRERRSWGRERRVSWLRCYGPRRPPGFPPPRERRSWGRERRVSWLRCCGPRRPPGFPPPRERRSWGRERRVSWAQGVLQPCWVPPRAPGFPLSRERRVSHPHPSPLPSREGGFGAGKRADTWVRPYGG